MSAVQENETCDPYMQLSACKKMGGYYEAQMTFFVCCSVFAVMNVVQGIRVRSVFMRRHARRKKPEQCKKKRKKNARKGRSRKGYMLPLVTYLLLFVANIAGASLHGLPLLYPNYNENLRFGQSKILQSTSALYRVGPRSSFLRWCSAVLTGYWVNFWLLWAPLCSSGLLNTFVWLLVLHVVAGKKRRKSWVTRRSSLSDASMRPTSPAAEPDTPQVSSFQRRDSAAPDGDEDGSERTWFSRTLYEGGMKKAWKVIFRVNAVLCSALFCVCAVGAAMEPVEILPNTISDRTRCLAQLRPGASFLLSAPRFLDRRSTMDNATRNYIMRGGSVIVGVGCCLFTNVVRTQGLVVVQRVTTKKAPQYVTKGEIVVCTIAALACFLDAGLGAPIRPVGWTDSLLPSFAMWVARQNTLPRRVFAQREPAAVHTWHFSCSRVAHCRTFPHLCNSRRRKGGQSCSARVLISP